METNTTMSDPLQVVCPHCNTTNRVPPARLAEHPKCGRCHEALFAGYPVELTTTTFPKHVTHNDLPVLVDFWAPWCGPCKMMAPAYAQAAAQLEPNVRVVKVDTEAEQALGAKYAIRSIPTLALFKGGREVARQSGAIGAAEIVRWVKGMV